MNTDGKGKFLHEGTEGTETERFGDRKIGNTDDRKFAQAAETFVDNSTDSSAKTRVAETQPRNGNCHERTQRSQRYLTTDCTERKAVTETTNSEPEGPTPMDMNF